MDSGLSWRQKSTTTGNGVSRGPGRPVYPDRVSQPNESVPGICDVLIILPQSIKLKDVNTDGAPSKQHLFRRHTILYEASNIQ